MHRITGSPRLAVAVFALTFTGLLEAAAPTASPDEVGLSAERLERIDELVDRHLEAGSFTGAVTLVARNGRIAHLEAHGFMDVEKRMPMPEDGIFRIMSMTKPVIGVATLMMIEEGKIRLQDPVSRYIPEWQDMMVGVPIMVPQGRGADAGQRGTGAGPRGAGAGQRDGGAGPRAGGAGPRGGGAPQEPRYYTLPVERAVTVRDLLTHTSGVVSGTISNFANRAVAAGPQDTLADYIPRLGDVPLEFNPGERWAYSAAAGFDVLSRIVEIASGMPIDRFLATRVFGPLGMNDTTYVPPTGNSRLVNLYSRGQGGLQPAQDPNFMNGVYFSGGGGLFSTAPDYAQFALMLANGGELGGMRILSPRSVELMGSVFVPDTLPGRQPGEAFGLSVRVITDPAARNTYLSEGSFGWSGLYGTHFWVDPQENLAAIVMTQTSDREFLGDFENMVMQAVID